MTLRTSLVIAGDSSDGVQAVKQMDAAMEAASAEAQKLAKSYVAADAAIGQLAKEQAAATREMQEAKAALNGGEIGLEQYNRRLLETKSALSLVEGEYRSAMSGLRSADAAWKAANDNMGHVTAATSMQKAGMQQLGFQLGDVATMYSLGARPAQIFASQIGQITQAVQLMSGGTSKLAAFLGGPWGIAISVAVIALTPFIASLLEADDAAGKVEFASYALHDAQGILAGVFDLTTGKINTQSTALLALAQAQLLVARVQAQARQAEARSQIAAMQDKKFADNSSMMGMSFSFKQRPYAGVGERVLDGTNTAKQAIDQLENMRTAGAITAKELTENAAAIANYGVETENLTVLAKAEASMLNGKLDPALIKTTKAHKAAKEHVDRHAESLARNTAAVEAQIAGLYEVADAYLESDSAALKAEISAKARADGIKKQADVDAYVAQQIRLSVAQRTADAAKNVSDLRAQADAQQLANNQVARGLMTAEEAAGFLKDEADLRPLIAAQAVAEGDARQKLTDIIAAQRAEQKRLNDETERAQSLARAEQIKRQTFDTRAETGLDAQIGNRRLGVLASDMNYAQQAEALRQLNVEHEKRLIMLKAEADIRNMGTRATPEETGAIKDKAQAESEAVDLRAAIDASADAMTRLRDVAHEIDFASVFGAGGEAIDGLIASIEKLQQAQVDYNQLMQSDDPKVRTQAEASYTKAKLAGAASVLGSTKKLFGEQSAMYKVITTAEKVLAAMQLANTIKSIAMDTTKTAASVANATVRTGADVAAGSAKMFSFLGPFAFPVVAAMIAVMASLGFKGGGSASAPSIPTAEELQKAAGTGSVLGDSSAKSNSIANAIEIVAANTNKDLEYSNAMLKSLRSIDTGISKMAGTVARQIQVAGGMFDTSGANLGSSGSSGFLGLFGSSTTRELWDVGLDLASATVGNIIAQGITGNTYQIVQQIKKSSGFLGIGGGTKTTYQTTTGEIDPSITGAINDVLASLRQGLVDASGVIGVEGAAAIIDGFQVSLGRISFKDMTGEEIESQLNAIFSKVGDDLAGAILPELSAMQLVGEGLFETFIRVAREYQVVDVSLKSIGLTFGSVGLASVEARDRLVQLFGSLDEFVTATDYYRDKFLTAAEQIAPLMSAVDAELARLGLSSVGTIDQFKSVVSGLDLTSTAGQDTYAALMALAPAFYQVEQYQAQQASAASSLVKKRAEMEIALLKAQGDAAGALAKQRAAELDAMDESLRPLQQQIYRAQDIATARDALSAAYKRESSDLQSVINKFGNFAATLKDFRETLTAGAGGVETYRAAMIRLMEVGGLAAGGDADAMGRFSGVATSFLDAAKGNASSLQEYQRAIAMVARYTDGAIGAADGQASVAQQQLDQMKSQVGALIDINDSVLSVHDAIASLAALAGGLSPTLTPSPTFAAPATQRTGSGDQEADGRIDRMEAALAQIAISTNQLLRLQRSWDRGGSLVISTDSDTPLKTTPA